MPAGAEAVATGVMPAGVEVVGTVSAAEVPWVAEATGAAASRR
mgnify:CR=1 FL=1